MNPLPQSEATLFVRTDFSDEAAWQALRTAVETPSDDDEFTAWLHIVDDPAYRDLTADQVVALAPEEESLIIVADKRSMSETEMPLLAVYTGTEDDEDDEEEAGPENRGGDDDLEPSPQELRVTAAVLWSVENNISMANMDWEEFVDATEEDGVFRGF